MMAQWTPWVVLVVVLLFLAGLLAATFHTPAPSPTTVAAAEQDEWEAAVATRAARAHATPTIVAHPTAVLNRPAQLAVKSATDVADAGFDIVVDASAPHTAESRIAGGTVEEASPASRSSLISRRPGVAEGQNIGDGFIADSTGEGRIANSTYDETGGARQENPSVWTPDPRGTPRADYTPNGTGEIAGRVIGRASRQGLANVEIRCDFLGYEYFTLASRTDGGGYFRFTQLLPGAYILFPHTGATATQVHLAEGQLLQIDLVVEETTEISGNVLDHQRRPVADADVELYQLAPVRRLLDADRSDSRGLYALINAPAGVELEIVASLGTVARDTRRLVLYGLEPRYGVDLILAPEGLIQGTVFDANRRPMANVRVTVTPLSSGAAMSTKSMITDHSGRFVLMNVPAGEYELSAEAAGLTKTTQRVTISHNNLAPTVNFFMLSGFVLAGVVLDEENNRPIAGAEVEVIASGFNDKRTTAADGRFRFDAVPHDSRPTIVARHPDYSTSGFGHPAPNDQNIVLRLSRLVQLLLEVNNPEGQPLTRYRISFYPHGAPASRYEEYIYTGLEVHTSGIEEFQLVRSRYLVVISAEGYAQKSFHINETDNGGVVGPIVLRMDYGLRLTGTVVNSGTGRGIPNATVTAYRGRVDLWSSGPIQVVGGPAGQTRADVAGNFVLEGMPPGELSLLATASDYERGGVTGVYLDAGSVPHVRVPLVPAAVGP